MSRGIQWIELAVPATLFLGLASIAGAQAPQPAFQVRFVGPAPGMRVTYQASRDGKFHEPALVAPARLDVPQPGVYRLKLTHIPGHEDLTLYPTLEIAPLTPRSQAFLAHTAIVIAFSERDIAEAAAGRFVTKAIVLPDEDAGLGRGGRPTRGATLAIVRLGDRLLSER